MKKLYSFDLSERVLAGMFRELLMKEGIKCLVRNEQLFTGLGEIPFVECYPELWIVDEEVYPRAMSLLKQYMENDTGAGPEQVCSECGEASESQFNACWNCGNSLESD